MRPLASCPFGFLFPGTFVAISEAVIRKKPFPFCFCFVKYQKSSLSCVKMLLLGANNPAEPFSAKFAPPISKRSDQAYLIFVTDATDGVRVNYFWPV